MRTSMMMITFLMILMITSLMILIITSNPVLKAVSQGGFIVVRTSVCMKLVRALLKIVESGSKRTFFAQSS